ncbi:unnamed protein product, partial [Ixodes hexagonus]
RLCPLEVEHRAPALAQVLLALEVYLGGALERDEGQSAEQAALQARLGQAREEEAAHQAGHRGQKQGAAQKPRRRHRVVRRHNQEQALGERRRVPPPEPQQVVLPAHHACEHEHDGNAGQADEQEERVGLFHDAQALLVAQHLHHRDRAVRDGRPVHRAHEQSRGHEGAGAIHCAIHQVQHVHGASCGRRRGPHHDVLAAALGARHLGRAVARLLLIDPALEAALVHPLGGAAALARLHPGRTLLLVLGSEAHPAYPPFARHVRRRGCRAHVARCHGRSHQLFEVAN